MDTLGFIGAGRMAGAMVAGLLKVRAVPTERMWCTSAADGTGEGLARQYGIHFSPDPLAVIGIADVLVLAIKPQQLVDLPTEVAEASRGRLVLSILAGTPLSRLRERFPRARQWVRAMPNTPGMIGAGISAYAATGTLSEADRGSVEAILGTLGRVIVVPESDLDAVTGLSGSGPAYVFEFVAALRDAGIAAGLSAEASYDLALETVRGAAELLRAVPETPETHRKWVSSPGGTTLAGLAVMEAGGFRDLIRRTVLAAQTRARELAQG